jgi:hypothetical protein
VGVTAGVTPVPPDSIERVSVGKARRVIDNRPKVRSSGVQGVQEFSRPR